MFEHPFLGMIGDGLIEFTDQVGEEDVTAAVTLLDGVDEKAGGQARLAAPGGAQPDDVLGLGDKVQAVVESQDGFPVQLGLAGKRKCLNGPGFGDARAPQALPQGVVALDSVFLLDHVSEEVGMGEALAGGLLEDLLPMSQETPQTEVFQFGGQFLIHRSERDRVGR